MRKVVVGSSTDKLHLRWYEKLVVAALIVGSAIIVFLILGGIYDFVKGSN